MRIFSEINPETNQVLGLAYRYNGLAAAEYEK
jgi:hypothetical protein